MQSIKKILSAIDFSAASEAALREAETLAHATGAELVLLHVIDEPAFVFPEGNYALPRIIEEYEHAMQSKLSEVAERVRPDLRASTKTVRGAPHQAIADAADSLKADLIVLGTHGRTGVSHLLLGSVAERVVRTARVPVMTVRS